MSSSGERRRPRVAGERRRRGRPPAPGTPGPGTQDPPLDEPAVEEQPAEEQPVEEQPAEGPEVAEPRLAEPVDGARATAPPGWLSEDPEPARTDDAAATGVEASDDDGPGDAEPPRRVPPRLAAALVALAVALVAFALVLSVSVRDPHDRERDARAATAAARTSLEQLLSYSYETLDAQASANAALLTGPFRTEYAQTMEKTIAPVATKDEVVVRARTYEAGVMGQTPDTVTVQVFLDQAKTSAGEDQPSVDQNRVIATMRKVSGRWLVEKLSAY